MPNSKISNLVAITGANVDPANDLIPIVDVSETDLSVGTRKITVNELLAGTSYAPINVRGYGAVGGGSTDDTTAIQAALTAAYAAGGGHVTFGTGADVFKITSALVLGTGVFLDLGGATIRQFTSNTPVIQVTEDALNERWGVGNGILDYDTQQTSSETDAIGVRLASTSITSYLGRLWDLKVDKAFSAVDLPQLSGCHAFLITLDNVVAIRCADWGFSLLGDNASGIQTTITFQNCWTVQIAGSEISTSKGFQLARIQDLRMDNCAVDHIQSVNSGVFFFTSCQGTIGSLAIESCDFSNSSGVGAYVGMSGSNLEIGEVTAIDNNVTISGSAAFAMVRSISGSRGRVAILQDKNSTVTDTSSDNYYTAIASSTEELYIDRFTRSGNSPSSVIGEFGTHKYLRYFDGSWRMQTEGGKNVIFGTAAPTGETWAVGDRVVNTTPLLLGSVAEWACVTAGTPGTWRPVAWVTGMSTTANRPTLTSSDIGVMYMDTTLDGDGKPIWWNGTAWVDATGATV